MRQGSAVEKGQGSLVCGEGLGALLSSEAARLTSGQWGSQAQSRLDKAAAAAAKSSQSCLTPCDPIDAGHQAPSSLGFSRQER